MRALVRFAAVLLLSGVSAPAFADIVYDVKSFGPDNNPFEFSFVESAFLTSTTTIQASGIDLITPASCSVTTAIIANPSSSNPSVALFYGTGCQLNGTTITGFTSPFTSFSNFSNGARFPTVVTLSAATTPEPSGLVLLATGVLGLGGAVRRRFR